MLSERMLVSGCRWLPSYAKASDGLRFPLRSSSFEGQVRSEMLVAGCWFLDAGCWWLVAGGWMPGAGCWWLVAGGWWLVAG